MNPTISNLILGFDPGRDKCGVAITDSQGTLHYHQVVESDQAIVILKSLFEQYSIDLIVMGNQTTSKQWKQTLDTEGLSSSPIVMVDERNSTLEARDRFWQMYPPKGFTRLIPQGMRVPPRPIDDIVAILLIERYLHTQLD